MDAQNTSDIEDPPLAKKVNKSLVFNVCNSSTDRHANSTVDNDKSLSKTSSFERRPEIMLFHQMLLICYKTHKNITIDHLNVNSLRNKIEAVEELIKKT